MKKISKKEIQKNLGDAINEALSKLEITEPSKKTSKSITKASKKLSTKLMREIKKLNRSLSKKAMNKTINGKSPKKTSKVELA
jgi:hypothetical protein